MYLAPELRQVYDEQARKFTAQSPGASRGGALNSGAADKEVFKRKIKAARSLERTLQGFVDSRNPNLKWVLSNCIAIASRNSFSLSLFLPLISMLDRIIDGNTTRTISRTRCSVTSETLIRTRHYGTAMRQSSSRVCSSWASRATFCLPTSFSSLAFTWLLKM